MTKEDKPKWDGKSRPSNDLYKKNYDEIFKKKVLEGEDPFETNKKELKVKIGYDKNNK